MNPLHLNKSSRVAQTSDHMAPYVSNINLKNVFSKQIDSDQGNCIIGNWQRLVYISPCTLITKFPL